MMVFSDPNDVSNSFIDQTTYTLKGEEDAPLSGTDEYSLWLATANRKLQEWARDVKQTWSSSWEKDSQNETGTVSTAATTTLTGTGTFFTDYRVGDQLTVSGETIRTIAAITSDTSLTVTVAFVNTASAITFTRTMIIGVGVQEYSLHRGLLEPSDRVVVTNIDGSTVYYYLVEPQQRAIYPTNTVYTSGRNPQILTFTADINTGDRIVGGTIQVPGYYMPSPLSAATDLIPIDDPMWLVYAVASEIAFNDVTYEDKYVDLNTKANNLYTLMASTNRRGTANNPRRVLTNVKRIRSPRC